MELIRGLHNLKPQHRGCVATIGNFDGVHLGHQAVLGQLAEKAALMGLPSVVITFEPQPREVFSHGATPPRLTRFREKMQALRRFSVDRVLCIRFNGRFAALSADDFIQRLLLDGLDVRYLVVGDDFRFGHQRQGTFAQLEAAGERFGFQVAKMHTFHVDGVRISSTLIRQALEDGDLQTAEKLLGRPYRMSGRVARGDARGRTIGFPTANIHLHRKASPIQGVYAVEVFGLENEPLQGVANVGTRPTVDGTRTLLEIHILDFNENVYRRYVQVDFLHKIRSEQKFESLDALKAQINQDIVSARAFFAGE
jgi:riboflavin kinase/FMN adenylyltransferase